MVRLFVQDGKTNKSFRVKPGRLSIGSGPEAKLRLSAPNVAPVHVELDVTDDGAVLRPLGGVAAPKVNGRPVRGETELSVGDQVGVGNARITLQEEDQPAQAPPPKPGAVRARRSSTPRGRRRGSASGLSPGVVRALGAVGALVLLFGLWKLFEATQTEDPNALLAAAERLVEGRERRRVEDVLARLPADLTPAQRERVAQIRVDLTGLRDESAASLANVEGHEFFDGKLMRYRRDHLPEGEPVEPRKVRYFLELCREFRERWPRHPELATVERLEGEFSAHGSVDHAPTWEQLDWCVKHWTGGSPRRYRDAFRLIAQFREECRDDACLRADELADELDAARGEYFDEKLKAAASALEGGNPSLAFYWFVELVVNIGDEGLEDHAAEALTSMPDAERYLEALRDREPYRFRQLVKEQAVRDFAREQGVI